MPDNSKATIICLAQSKGGTSKTSSTLNIGAALYRAGKKVLLIDLDQQANLTNSLGIAPASLPLSTYHLMTDRAIQARDLLITELPGGEPGLHLLPATLDLVGIERALAGEIGRERFLYKKLIPLLSDYDYILVDTPPSFDAGTINGMTASDFILVPFQPEQDCVNGLMQVLDKMRAIQENIKPDLALLGVFITMYDHRLNGHREFTSQLRAEMTADIFDTTVRRRANIATARASCRSVVSFESSSELAQDYINLAGEVLSRAKR
jgi:chromosome partitioning protein